MPMPHIANGESGLSVRNKLILVIDDANASFPDVMNVAYTGTLPPSFPYIAASSSKSVAIVTASGDTTLLKLNGVSTELSISPIDPQALLTSLTLGNLAYVGGAFSPATMASLTTLSAPALAYVGGAFSPASMASLTTLSA